MLDTTGFPDKVYLMEYIRFNQIISDEINDIMYKYKKRKNINNEILSEMQEHYKKFKDNNYNISRKEYNKYWYKFELLFNIKHNSLKSETFHKNCDRKGSTVVIIKLLDSDLIEDENVWKKSSDSFLFQKNHRNYKKVNIKPESEEMAIHCGTVYGLTVRRNNLYIQNSSGFCIVKDSYYKSLNVSERFQMACYEVLRVIKQRQYI
ncbi:39801_t:CDS:2 [Gigaspora margarita]|uniref:39801_t:CDS:1 n=1 Tax=Gigaspora margarita TaxID=4874 RepID=A0ABN7W5U5_GIGMA|nr:39801_t:CDS:2 [Gigaspora margarita]